METEIGKLTASEIEEIEWAENEINRLTIIQNPGWQHGCRALLAGIHRIVYGKREISQPGPSCEASGAKE